MTFQLDYVEMLPLFQHVIHSLSLPIIFLDSDGVCLYVNNKAERLLSNKNIDIDNCKSQVESQSEIEGEIVKEIVGATVSFTLIGHRLAVFDRRLGNELFKDDASDRILAGDELQLMRLCLQSQVLVARVEVLKFIDGVTGLVIHSVLPSIPSDYSKIDYEKSDYGKSSVQESLDKVASGTFKMQDTHLHPQRLETLGILAGGVAHDFNNMLTGILGHVSFLKSILPRTGTHIESIDAIEQGAKKSAQITRQILAFAKKEEDEVTQISLREVVVSTCKLLRGALSPNFRLNLDITDSECIVLGSEGPLSQVIVNLVINARDALPESGEIGVELKELDLGKSEQQAVAGSGLYAMLRITDKGCGIPREVQKFIFRPFFSTKAGRGIGLGLSTVWSIVTNLGGVVEVESEESVGTTVTVFLSLMVASDSLSKNLQKSSAVGTGGDNPLRIDDKSQAELSSSFDSDKTILIVDDEELVRNAIAMSLRHLGYSVESAASGEEALEKLKSRQIPFLLAMVDMVMPYLGGDLVVREIRERFPDMPVIVISGMWVPETVDDLLTHPATFFLRKPFTIRDLSSAIKRAILAAGPIIQDTRM